MIGVTAAAARFLPSSRVYRSVSNAGRCLVSLGSMLGARVLNAARTPWLRVIFTWSSSHSRWNALKRLTRRL